MKIVIPVILLEKVPINLCHPSITSANHQWLWRSSWTSWRLLDRNNNKIIPTRKKLGTSTQKSQYGIFLEPHKLLTSTIQSRRNRKCSGSIILSSVKNITARQVKKIIFCLVWFVWLAFWLVLWYLVWYFFGFIFSYATSSIYSNWQRYISGHKGFKQNIYVKEIFFLITGLRQQYLRRKLVLREIPLTYRLTMVILSSSLVISELIRITFLKTAFFT